MEEVQNDLSVHFSSKTDQWATPQDLFDKLNVVFNFETDVCADATNAKCENFYTEEMDGLKQVWGGVLLDEPAIRQTDRRLARESLYKLERKWRHSRLFDTSPHRHSLLA